MKSKFQESYLCYVMCLTCCVAASWIEEDLTRCELVMKSPDWLQQYVLSNVPLSTVLFAPCQAEKVAGAVTI